MPVCWWFLIFFFFKQKTAYEMRISDWSSDVCSSDLDQADAACSGRWIGLRHDDDDVGALSVADKGLGAVYDIIVAVADGARSDGLQVGAAAGFGHRDRRDRIARRHARQPVPLLRLGAIAGKIAADDAIGRAHV